MCYVAKAKYCENATQNGPRVMWCFSSFLPSLNSMMGLCKTTARRKYCTRDSPSEQMFITLTWCTKSINFYYIDHRRKKVIFGATWGKMNTDFKLWFFFFFWLKKILLNLIPYPFIPFDFRLNVYLLVKRWSPYSDMYVWGNNNVLSNKLLCKIHMK